MNFHEIKKMKIEPIPLLQIIRQKLTIDLNLMSLRLLKKLRLKRHRPSSLRLMRGAKISSSKKRILRIAAQKILKRKLMLLKRIKRQKKCQPWMNLWKVKSMTQKRIEKRNKKKRRRKFSFLRTKPSMSLLKMIRVLKIS